MFPDQLVVFSIFHIGPAGAGGPMFTLRVVNMVAGPDNQKAVLGIGYSPLMQYRWRDGQ